MTLEGFIKKLENFDDISPFEYRDLILLLYELKAYREKIKSGELIVNVPLVERDRLTLEDLMSFFGYIVNDFLQKQEARTDE